MKSIHPSAILLTAMITSACSQKTICSTASRTAEQQAIAANDPERGNRLETERRLSPNDETFLAPQEINSGPDMAMPAHLIYRMSGDYADLVPVTIDSKGNLTSYPDPIDITDAQRPLPLGDGWYLDRRGISENTAFLDYTYGQYHSLKKVPDQATLKAHIKARHAITAIWSCGTQSRTTEEYRKLVADGFPGCKSIMFAAQIDK